MKSPRQGSSLIGSVALHAVLVGAAVFAQNRLARRVIPPVEDHSVDIEMSAPTPEPLTPSPATPPPTAESAPAATPHAPATTTAARAARVAPVGPSVLTGQEPTEAGTIQSSPSPTAAVVVPPEVPPGPPITAAELYGNAHALAAAAARAGYVDLGPPNGGYHASRNLFGGPARTGTEEERVRAVAMAPITAALSESNHMRSAGAGTHDARVSRRAAEEFSPVRTIANIGNAVLRAPTVQLGPARHDATNGGEIAATEGLDAAHAGSFGMMPLLAVPPPAVHVVRAEVEVDQDHAGNVVATRVVRPSGVPGFDAEALRAIREAMPSAAEVRMPPNAGRRTQWSFEVSNAQGAGAQLLGGGNEGWTMIPEASNGVSLRMRVRIVRERPLPTQQGT